MGKNNHIGSSEGQGPDDFSLCLENNIKLDGRNGKWHDMNTIRKGDVRWMQLRSALSAWEIWGS
jgi:hypothetical protein